VSACACVCAHMRVRVRVCAVQDSVVLTPLGLHLSRMPVDVRVGHPARSINAAHGLTPTHATAQAKANERRHANRACPHARTNSQTNGAGRQPCGRGTDFAKTGLVPQGRMTKSSLRITHIQRHTHSRIHARTRTRLHTRTRNAHTRVRARTHTRTNTHAHAGKMILFGAMFRCVEPTLAIAAMMGAKSVRTKRERCEVGAGEAGEC
jgi:hypothetical protein